MVTPTKIRAGQIWVALDFLPLAAPVLLAVFGLVMTIALLSGQLRDRYALGLGLPLAAAACVVLGVYYFRSSEEQDRERKVFNLLVLAGVAVWGLFNSFYTSRHVITDRDPGVYANTGEWLVRHDDLVMRPTTVFGNAPHLTVTAPGFDALTVHGHTQVYAQGLHLLPILLGLSGRIFGGDQIFRINILFGMTALLAIYAVGRVLVRPFWAATVTAVLATSMPFIYFSRDTYTEPLAATFVFGALAVLYVAIKSRKPALWFLAGLIGGAMTLTRVDGYLVIGGFMLFLIAHMLAKSRPRERRQALIGSSAALAGLFLSGLVGWLDLSRLSAPYYHNIRHQFVQELAVIVLLAVAGMAVAAVVWKRRALLSRFERYTRGWRSVAAPAAVLSVVLILASRPLWYRGLDAAGNRNMSEITTEWLSWYIGPLLAFLGAGGLALAAMRIVKKYDPMLTAVFMVVASSSIVYLINPSIFPDQIWASRRLVPVIMPGVALFGALALEWISREYGRKIRWRYYFAGIAAVALVLGPLITSRPVLLDHDTDMLAPIQAVCANLPAKTAVLWVGMAGSHLVQPTDSFCGVPAAGYGEFFKSGVPDAAALSQIAGTVQGHGFNLVVGLYGSDRHLLPDQLQSELVTIDTFTLNQLDHPDANPPRQVNKTNDSILLSTVRPSAVTN